MYAPGTILSYDGEACIVVSDYVFVTLAMGVPWNESMWLVDWLILADGRESAISYQPGTRLFLGGDTCTVLTEGKVMITTRNGRVWREMMPLSVWLHLAGAEPAEPARHADYGPACDAYCSPPACDAYCSPPACDADCDADCSPLEYECPPSSPVEQPSPQPSTNDDTLARWAQSRIVNEGWPFMRVKNFLKILGLPVPRSHSEGLNTLASIKKISLEDLLRTHPFDYAKNNPRLCSYLNRIGIWTNRQY